MRRSLVAAASLLVVLNVVSVLGAEEERESRPRRPPTRR